MLIMIKRDCVGDLLFDVLEESITDEITSNLFGYLWLKISPNVLDYLRFTNECVDWSRLND